MPKGIDKKWSEEETVIKVAKNCFKCCKILITVLEKICERIKTIW